MPRTIPFHLDENCDPRIVAGLRLHGIEELGALCPSSEWLRAYLLKPDAPEFANVRYHIQEA